MKLISIVTPCYNEEGNVELLNSRVRDIFARLPEYDYEHIFIDNASSDTTVSILKGMAQRDKRIKIIVNSRNFGHIRSPHHALLQAQGTAVVLLFSDLQDPPELILDFIKKWEEGYKVVMGVKIQSEESSVFFAIRKMYYKLINTLSDIPLTENFTGFGLYDRKIIDLLREMNDVYPYFRGLVASIGFESTTISYHQAARKRGITKNNFYTLYDLAMLGITNHSKIPLRLATMIGFLLSMLSLLAAVAFLFAKLLFWSKFTLGIAPLVIGLFFFSSVQLFFLGIIGEYIGAIHTQVLKRPLVIERERINFDAETGRIAERGGEKQ